MSSYAFGSFQVRPDCLWLLGLEIFMRMLTVEELKPEKRSKWNKLKETRNETSEEPLTIVFILI